MNKDQFSGKWHELKGKIKEKWGKLTDNDITEINGKWEQFVGKLQKRYGYQKEEAERQLNHWCRDCGCGCESKGGAHKKDSEREMRHGERKNPDMREGMGKKEYFHDSRKEEGHSHFSKGEQNRDQNEWEDRDERKPKAQ